MVRPSCVGGTGQINYLAWPTAETAAKQYQRVIWGLAHPLSGCPFSGQSAAPTWSGRSSTRVTRARSRLGGRHHGPPHGVKQWDLLSGLSRSTCYGLGGASPPSSPACLAQRGIF